MATDSGDGPFDESALEQAARELAASERRWRALLEQASDGIFVADADLRFVEANAAACQMLGYTREELLELRVPDLADGAELERQRSDLERIRAGQTVRTERTMRRKDGTTFFAEISARMIPPELGVLQAIVRDVTERREAEDRLRRSEALFRTVTEYLPDAVAVIRDGRIVFVNPAAMRMFGAQRVDQVLGHAALDYVHPDERAAAAERIRVATDGGAVAPRERRVIGLDGRELRARVVALPIVFDGEPALMSILHDVTEQHRLEARLQRSQRMEAVGRLAGGIAHDFNNMLSVILSYAEIASLHVPEGSPTHESLLQIKDAAQRSAALTRQLLSFSRHQVIEAEVLDPSRVVREMAELLRGMLGGTVELRARFEAPSWHVRIPPSQLEQIMINLAVNARDAMPGGGELVIETANVADPLGGRWVRITARDTGCGMDPDVAEHAFEPFFSTKGSGERSGLGLSVVYGIVTRNRGTIELETEPGRGTAFHIRLPAIDAEPPSSKERAAGSRPAGRGERVLVVEDEAAVRAVVVRLLSQHGYRPVAAAAPDEALRIAGADDSLDLLLTDVVMPGMNGADLFTAVSAVRPGMRVLFMSGYADGAVDGLEAGDGFLPKPFTVEELLAAVRDALDRDA